MDNDADDAKPAPAARKPPSWPTTGKVDVLLNRLSRKILADECQRRGATVTPTINSLVSEWSLLQGLRRATQWRGQMKAELAAVLAAAYVLGGTGPGRPGHNSARVLLDAAAAVAERRLLEVMTI